MKTLLQKKRQLEMTALFLAVRAYQRLPFRDDLYLDVKQLQREIKAAELEDEKVKRLFISLN